jgi:hypothetical protein
MQGQNAETLKNSAVMITKNRSCDLQKDENRYESWLKIRKAG